MKRLLCLLICCLLLASCAFRSGESLLFPPKAPLEYRHLQSQLEKFMAAGAVYAPPVSGYNRQTIQIIDLDGDGEEEALVFTRETDDRPLKIRIFSKDGDEYKLFGIIEGVGDAIDSIDYRELDSDGKKEILTGWKVGGVLKALTVHTIIDGTVSEILSTPYDGYTISDINGNGCDNLLVVRYDTAKLTGCVDMYERNGAELERTSQVSLSSEVEMLTRIAVGVLADNTPAMFVASQYKVGSIITDVIIFSDDTLVNISISMHTHVSDSTIRSNLGSTTLYAMDINDDGVLDLPRPSDLPPYDIDEQTEGKAPVTEVIWGNYTSSGELVETVRTYHNVSSGWYLILPQNWAGNLTVGRRDYAGQRIITFAEVGRNGDPPRDIVAIYTINKAIGEVVDLHNKLLLHEKVDLIIAADIYPSEGFSMGMTQEELLKSFKLIQQEWFAGV